MYRSFKADSKKTTGKSFKAKEVVKKPHENGKKSAKKKPESRENSSKKKEETKLISQRILDGDVEAARSVEKKSIRLFVSSTFTDTKVERNHLMKHVFPSIREFCQKKGIAFTVVDLRWGIRDEATNDHMTTEICLNEIDKCYELTIEGAPCFMYLSFDKYGYRPIPRTIPETDFDAILNICSKARADIFKKWYKLDKNAVPPLYTLQAISTHFPSFSKPLPSEEKREILKSFWADEEAMRGSVFDAAHKLDKSIKKSWSLSVTEKEVRRGPLSAENIANDSLCIVRSIPQLKTLDLNDNDCGAVNRFIDVIETDGKKAIDEDAQTKVQYLRSEIEGKTTIVSETVKWVKPQGVAETTHTKYLSKLSGEIKTRLLNGITSAIDNQARLDDFTSEVASHLRFAGKRSNGFYGRSDLIKECSKYFETKDEKRYPLVIHGISGSGKTSLVAAVAFWAKKFFSSRKSIFAIRFCGTSPMSTSGSNLLQSICMQLRRSFDGNLEYVPPDNYHKLILEFQRLLMKAYEERPILIFIDSLDQLNDDDRARSDLEWLPTILPPNVYIIISTLENIGGSFKKLRQLDIPKTNYVEVKQLSSEDAETIMKGWLKESNRTLVEYQFEAVMDVALDSNIEPPTALRLRLLYDIAKTITSYEIRYAMLPNSVRGLINLIFENLENQHGIELVKTCFGFISASKNGLSELELMDLLSCSEDVLDSVLQYHKPPTRRLPFVCFARLQNDVKDYIVERGANGKSVLSWYHRQFWEAAESRYFSTPFARVKCSTMLLDYYSGAFASKYSDRNIPNQPLVWTDSESKKRITNASKVAEMPHAFWKYLLSIGELRKMKDKLKEDELYLIDFEPRIKQFGEMVFDIKFLSTSCKIGVARDMLKYFSLIQKEYKPEGFNTFIKFLNGTIHIIEQFPLLVVQEGLTYPKKNRMYEAAVEYIHSSKLSDAYPWLTPNTVLPLVTQGNKYEVEDPCLITLDNGHKGEVRQCKVVKDYIISMCKSGILAVWNIISGTLLYRIECVVDVETFLVFPASDCDKTDYFVISGNSSGRVALIKLILGEEVTGDLVYSFSAHKNQKIRTMAVSKDRRRLVTGTDYAIIKEHTDEAYENESNFGDIAVWNLTALIEDNKEECVIRKEKFIAEQNIFSLSFLPDESALMVGFGNRLNGQVLQNRIGIYNWPSLETLFIDEKAKYDYFYFAFIEDDGDGSKDTPFKCFVTTTLHLDRYNLYKNSDSKYVFDLVWRSDVGTGVHYAGLVISPDRKLVCCAQQNNLVLYYAETGERLIRLRGHGGTIWSMDMIPHVNKKMTENGMVQFIYSASSDKTLKVWEVDPTKLKDFVAWPPACHDCACSAITLSPCQEKIISGSDRGRNLADLRVWSATDVKWLGRTNQWTDRFDAIKITLDKKLVLTRCDISNEVRYIPYERFHQFKIDIMNSWDWIYVKLPGNERERCVCHGSKCLEISPDGKKLLACGAAESGVFLVDAESKELICLDHEGDGIGGCFSPDGLMAVTYSNGFHRQDQMTIHESCGIEVASELKLWQLKKIPKLLTSKLATKSELQVVDWRWPRKMRGFSNARYSPDGKCLVTAIWTGILQIRDTKSLDVIKEIQGHSDIIHCLSFSSTSTFFVSGGEDKWIKVWRVPSLKKAAEYYVGRGVECLDIFKQTDENVLKIVCGDAGGNIKILNAKDIKE